MAGAIGGIIGGWFKLGWDVTWPPHVLTPVWMSSSIHFAFSIVGGIAYGALVELLPIVAIRTGIGFGIAVWIGAHEVVMPSIGLTPPAWDLPANEQGSEFLGHALWGFVIGVFYHDFRGRFVKPNQTLIHAAEPVVPVAESVAVFFK